MDSKLDNHTIYDTTDETFSTQVGFKPNPELFDSVLFDIKSIVKSSKAPTKKERL